MERSGDEREGCANLVVERAGGPVFYWLKPSRPAEGLITRAQAELRSPRSSPGRDVRVPVEPQPGSDVTFRQACEEWMRSVVELDRTRRPSTVRDYRREIDRRLVSKFGADTLLSAITTGDFTALEPHEVELLAQQAVTDRDAALFTGAAFSGLRLGELRGLRWADIDWM